MQLDISAMVSTTRRAIRTFPAVIKLNAIRLPIGIGLLRQAVRASGNALRGSGALPPLRWRGSASAWMKPCNLRADAGDAVSRLTGFEHVTFGS
jgi:hypothetical protein